MQNSEDILNRLWKEVLNELEKEYDSIKFQGFIEPHFSINEISGNIVNILVDSETVYKTVLKTLESEIEIFERVFEKVTNTDYKVVFVTKKMLQNKKKEEVVKKNYEFFDQSLVNKCFSFDNYVVGPSNFQAFSATQYILNPQSGLKSLFIYANSGLGKTHLMSAFYNEYKKLYPNKKIKYVCVGDFRDVYVKVFKSERDGDKDLSVIALKEYFYDLDCVLFDDIQFLTGKKKTQEVFFDIYENLIKRNAQVIFTSDCKPEHIPDIEKRIVTRLTSGLSCPIKVPEKETMKQILIKKIDAARLDLKRFDDEVLDYIVTKFSTNVRELEGGLNRLSFYMILNNYLEDKITLSFAREAFDDTQTTVVLNKNQKTISPDDIIYQVSCHFNLTVGQLMTKTRTAQIAYARQVCMYIIRKILGLPYAEIARKFEKDHSTVISACKKIEKEYNSNTEFKQICDKIINKVN